MQVKEIIQKAGGCFRLSKSLGITHAAVRKWKTVPVKRLLAVERITGIPREELRPDIFCEEKRKNGCVK
ncbi:hypothetical protein COMNV_01636 [Commensalibacter sp. Nvir]|uniref:transcriptional regulator n=1 Tax=Commensalibacter sp. Nvir TaxID=3069817 RepID=UPI002D39E03F|nr:hypothetical protein COMNV_01636 [Commensalibacter sp. Nvir]